MTKETKAETPKIFSFQETLISNKVKVNSLGMYYGMNFDNFGFDHVNFEFTVFKGCSFKDASFTDCKLKGCMFLDCDFTEADFLDCDLEHMVSTLGTFDHTTFHGCNLTYAVFNLATMHDGEFYKSDLTNSSFIRFISKSCLFEKLNCTNVVMSDSQVTDSTWYEAGLGKIQTLNTHIQEKVDVSKIHDNYVKMVGKK